MEQPSLHQDSPAWVAFTQISFVLSLIAMGVGIYYMPVELWVRGYLAMGTLFVVSSTVVASKTMRDQHESRKIVNKIQEVKTERLLKDYDAPR